MLLLSTYVCCSREAGEGHALSPTNPGHAVLVRMFEARRDRRPYIARHDVLSRALVLPMRYESGLILVKIDGLGGDSRSSMVVIPAQARF